ncbi:type II secretion system F family protein [Candidatus Bathyarchaeota archaeon]|nr:type II secretion system F family protein [Candidatus Bathyarchaeota archaeon]
MKRLEGFLNIGYFVFRGRPASVFNPLVGRIRENLLRAYIRISPPVYAAGMFFWTLVSIPAAMVVAELIIGYVSFIPPMLVRVLTVTIIPITVFSILYFYPHYVAGSVKRRIERYLAYIVGCMSILASAEASIEQIFDFLAKEGEIFGVKDYARNVLRDISLLGLDALTAIEEEAMRCPSERFREFIQGYMTTFKAGGDMRNFLESSFKRVIESRRLYLTKLVDTLNLIAEVYITVLIVFPVIMVTMLTLMGLVGGLVLGFLNPIALAYVIIYLLIPVTATAALLILDMVLSGW